MNAPKIPKRNDPLGQFNIVVLERKVSTDAALANGARVTVEYGVPDTSASVGSTASSPTRIEMKVGTVSEETFFDINGNFLRVSYQGVQSLGLKLTQLQKAEIQRPIFRFTARRDEAKIPFLKAQEFTGTVNSAQFFNFAPKSLLLLGVGNSETNKGLSQEVTYEFIWRKATWVHEVSIIFDGKLPTDAQIGNGLELFDVFEAKDFSGLGVSLKV